MKILRVIETDEDFITSVWAYGRGAILSAEHDHCTAVGTEILQRSRGHVDFFFKSSDWPTHLEVTKIKSNLCN